MEIEVINWFFNWISFWRVDRYFEAVVTNDRREEEWHACDEFDELRDKVFAISLTARKENNEQTRDKLRLLIKEVSELHESAEIDTEVLGRKQALRRLSTKLSILKQKVSG